MLVNNVVWRKGVDGKWKFYVFRDNMDRHWPEHINDDGYVVIKTGDFVAGYCKDGAEDKWKNKLKDIVIKDLYNAKNKIDVCIKELESSM